MPARRPAPPTPGPVAVPVRTYGPIILTDGTTWRKATAGGSGVGSEVHLSGRLGRWRIAAFVTQGDREWLEVVGPLGRGTARNRAVSIADVTTIHRKGNR